LADGKNVTKLSKRGLDATTLLQSDFIRSPLTGYTESHLNLSNSSADQDYPVPNVVHYVWFGIDRHFSFIYYLSFISVNKFISPTYIFVHGDALPAETVWWKKVLEEVDNIYFVQTVRRTSAPNGQPLHLVEHSTDLARIKILMDYGGIYLDNDVLVLKSFDDLRRHPYVMGRATDIDINCGTVLATKGAPFLSLWLLSYDSYRGKGEQYSHKATIVPHQLAMLYPNLIHVEERSLNRPNWKQHEMRVLYLGKYDWSSNYAIHVWHRYLPQGAKVPQGPGHINQAQTTLGEICRYILYDSAKLRNK